MSDSALAGKHCKAIAGDTTPLSRSRVDALLGELHADWASDADGREISRTFRFGNYYKTMAFVNALAWIAHAEDHHPDIEVGYNRCHVRFSTHSIGGLSENDFICAARIDALLPSPE